jgi:hypothetical protein
VVELRAEAIEKMRRASRLPWRVTRAGDAIRTNLSYVLHERSDSPAVRAVAREAARHRQRMGSAPGRLRRPVTKVGQLPSSDTLVISASIGLPHLLLAALERPGADLLLIDGDGPSIPATFFRGDAELVLPATDCTVIVAALVLRPGGSSSHLVVSDLRLWPEDRHIILDAVERLIQAFANQWHPAQPLWPVPAERAPTLKHELE